MALQIDEDVLALAGDEQFLGAIPGRSVQSDRGIHDRGGREDGDGVRGLAAEELVQPLQELGTLMRRMS